MLTRPGARIWRHTPKALVFSAQCEGVNHPSLFFHETLAVVKTLCEVSLHLVLLPSH